MACRLSGGKEESGLSDKEITASLDSANVQFLSEMINILVTRVNLHCLHNNDIQSLARSS